METCKTCKWFSFVRFGHSRNSRQTKALAETRKQRRFCLLFICVGIGFGVAIVVVCLEWTNLRSHPQGCKKGSTKKTIKGPSASRSSIVISLSYDELPLPGRKVQKHANLKMKDGPRLLCHRSFIQMRQNVSWT